MDYDRALYRVYEKFIEDLTQTQPIFDTNNNRQQNQDGEEQDAHLSTPGQTQGPNNVIPFLWPLFLLRFLEYIKNGRMNASSIWNRIRSSTNHGRLRRPRTRMFSRIATQEEDIRNEDIEQGHEFSLEMTSLSLPGLRRRNNSNSSSEASNESTPMSSNNTIQRPRRNQSNYDSNDDNSDEFTAQTETTRMAQEIARLAQQQRQLEDEEPKACSQKGLFAIMRVSMFFAIFHIAVLFCLHKTYIGPGISKYIIENGIIPDRKMTCLEYALSTRPKENRSQFFQLFGEDMEDDEDDTSVEAYTSKTFKKNDEGKHFAVNSTNMTEVEAPLLGRDEILQIKIVYGNGCKNVKGQCSRVHNVVPTNTSGTNTTKADIFQSLLGLASKEKKLNSTEKYTNADYWNVPAYRYSSNEALMFMDKKMIAYHNISLVNVTLSEQCLSTGSDTGAYTRINKIAQFLSQIYGMDAIIINQLMYGIKSTDGSFRSGHIKNIDTKERWNYSKDILKEEHDINHNIFTRVFNRLGVLAMALLAFSMIMSITALIVRLLTSSGVMVLLPLFSISRAFGINPDERILMYSYPWIGRATRLIRRQGTHPVNHFLIANVGKLFLLYTMYESCQVMWSSMLYPKSIPTNLPLWIFGNAMIIEYFSMIFVRSALR